METWAVLCPKSSHRLSPSLHEERRGGEGPASGHAVRDPPHPSPQHKPGSPQQCNALVRPSNICGGYHGEQRWGTVSPRTTGRNELHQNAAPRSPGWLLQGVTA